jgi:hypothetical protein
MTAGWTNKRDMRNVGGYIGTRTKERTIGERELL